MLTAVDGHAVIVAEGASRKVSGGERRVAAGKYSQFAGNGRIHAAGVVFGQGHAPCARYAPS